LVRVALLGMEIEFASFGPIRDAVGEKAIRREVPEGATVSDVLEELATEFPDLAGRLFDEDGLSTGVTVTINGTHVRQLDGGETTLADGDVLRAAPPVRGG